MALLTLPNASDHHWRPRPELAPNVTPSLFTFDGLRNGAIAAVSGCGRIRDGDVIVNDRTGEWSTWIERSVHLD
jgi:hypothetical protein